MSMTLEVTSPSPWLLQQDYMNNVSAAYSLYNDSLLAAAAAGGSDGTGGSLAAAAAISGDDAADKSQQPQAEVTANVTVAMAAMDAAMATSGGGDRHALLYIVVVLAFYAIGIIAALTMYLRQERADIDEEKVYDDYAAIHRDPWKWARYYRMQQVMTRLHSLKMENDTTSITNTGQQRNPRGEGGGNGQQQHAGRQHNLDEAAAHLNEDLDELTIDIPRLLGDGGATKRMALPDGETVVVTFRMPSSADNGGGGGGGGGGAFRCSRPSSLIRKRYETIDEERESVTDSDKSSHLGENGTTADNELSDDSIKERQRLRLGSSSRSLKRKRSFEQPLLTSRYDRGEKNEFNILDDEEANRVLIDDASSETGFEPQDNGAMLRSWGIKPRISRWSDCMDLSELTSSPTDDHSDGNLLSSIGSPGPRENLVDNKEKANLSAAAAMIANVSASVKPKAPPVTIQYIVDEQSDMLMNTNQGIKARPGDVYNIPTASSMMHDADFDSDPTSLESSHKRQNFGACDLRWKSEGSSKKGGGSAGGYLKLPMSSSATFKSSKPTDIDEAYKEMTVPFSQSRMIYDLLEANYSRSLPFLSATKGKPTDIDSVSQLLTMNTDVDIEGGLMHGIRCSSSPSIPNCKASDIFQFARPDSSESHFYDQQDLLGVPGVVPRGLRTHHPGGVTSSTDGSLSSIENTLADITVTLPESSITNSSTNSSHFHPSRHPQQQQQQQQLPSNAISQQQPQHHAPNTGGGTGLILQPQEYIRSANVSKVAAPHVPTVAPTAAPPPAAITANITKAATPEPRPDPATTANKVKTPSLGSSFSKSGSCHSSCDEPNLTPNKTKFKREDSRSSMKSLASLHSLTKQNSIELPKSPNFGQQVDALNQEAKGSKERTTDVFEMSPSAESLSEESLGLSDIDNPPDDKEPMSARRDNTITAPSASATKVTPVVKATQPREKSTINSHSRPVDKNTDLKTVQKDKSTDGKVLIAPTSVIDSSLSPKRPLTTNSTGRGNVNSLVGSPANNRDKSGGIDESESVLSNYPKLNEKAEGGSLDNDEVTSGEYTSCDEISLLADDVYVYASNERVNSDFEDEDAEVDDLSDEFASETFTELEKLADVGSVDNLLDECCGTPDGSDLPLDLPPDGRSRITPDNYIDETFHGARPRPEGGGGQTTFTDAKISNAEEIIQKWIEDNIKTGDMKSVKHKMGSTRTSAIPKPATASSGASAAGSNNYIQSSKRETTFLPDSHKCVSESTLGDVISDNRGAAVKNTATTKPGSAAIKPKAGSAGKPPTMKGSSAGIATRAATAAVLHRKIPPAPARGGNFAGSGISLSQAAGNRNAMNRPTTAPISRLRTPGKSQKPGTGGPGGMGAGGGSLINNNNKGSYHPNNNNNSVENVSRTSAGLSQKHTTFDSNNKDLNTTSSHSHSANKLHPRRRPATAASMTASAANGSVANRRRPNTALERANPSSSLTAASQAALRSNISKQQQLLHQQQQQPQQQQGPSGSSKYATKIQPLSSSLSSRPRPRTQVGQSPDPKPNNASNATGASGVMQLSHKLKTGAGGAGAAQGGVGGGGGGVVNASGGGTGVSKASVVSAASSKVAPVVSKVAPQVTSNSGPHHVHGATSGLDMTPRTARRLTSRVTTI